MSKVKIKVSIKSEEKDQSYETNALFQENILKYKEEDLTTVIFNIEKNELIRENKELKMHYLFKEKEITKGLIEIKEFRKQLRVNLETKEIQKENKNRKIIFQVEEKPFIYQVEVLE